MTISVTFIVTLDPQYIMGDGRKWGLLGKKVNQLYIADGTSITVTTPIESIEGNDYRGDSVVGKKGDRFVYFGLEQDGQWLRRWKLRHKQLDEIFNDAASTELNVYVFLGHEVTPQILLPA